MSFSVWCIVSLFYCMFVLFSGPTPHIFHTPMARYSLFVLKMPLNTNQLTGVFLHSWEKEYCSAWWVPTCQSPTSSTSFHNTRLLSYTNYYVHLCRAIESRCNIITIIAAIIILLLLILFLKRHTVITWEAGLQKCQSQSKLATHFQNKFLICMTLALLLFISP